MRGKRESRETSREAITVIQAEVPGGSAGGGKNWPNTRYVLKE